ncbi:MAG: PEPxxWA-CTERM sorting domain-containing protein [Sphingomonas sp.]
MRVLASSLIAATVFAAAPADASVIVTVSAFNNSTTGGTAAVTGLTFAPGRKFRITSSTNDLWSSGVLPRFSDANGLTGNRFAIAGDDSGQAPGTLIGTNFGLYAQGNLSAPFGALVAVLGPNQFQLLGANGIFTSQGGPLNLGYFDSNNFDNAGEISFAISAVPEASTWALMIVGFAAIGAGMRGRRKVSVAFAG